MYFPDFSPYEYNLPGALEGILNVGWLEKGSTFPVGDVSTQTLNKLLLLVVHKQVYSTRGLHYCNFCTEEDIWVQVDGERALLGHAEVWVPSTEGSAIFAAPTLIYHYIKSHRYLPPSQFLEAIEGFPLSTKWDGEEIRNRLVSKLFEKK